MLRTVGGAFLMVFGAAMLLGGFFIGRGGSMMTVLLGAAMVYVGQQWYRGRRITESPVGTPAVKLPNTPPGFVPDFWNRNIALDATNGALWLRDESGATTTLQRNEVVSWEGTSNSSNHQTLVGPKTAHLNNRLLIKTRNLSKPLWSIRFNAHPERTEGGANANHAELQEWVARLNAIFSVEAR